MINGGVGRALELTIGGCIGERKKKTKVRSEKKSVSGGPNLKMVTKH